MVRVVKLATPTAPHQSPHTTEDGPDFSVSWETASHSTDPEISSHRGALEVERIRRTTNICVESAGAMSGYDEEGGHPSEPWEL